MEEELEFLLEDENILEAEITDVVDKHGKTTVGLSITVGMNDEQLDTLIDLVGIDYISKVTTGFEIVLTKSDLKKINKLINEYE